jgi:hypothetical protein
MVWRSVLAVIFSLARRRPRVEQTEPELRLEICGMCGRDFVNPVAWESVGSEHWRLLLRCGECGTWCDVTVTNAVAERYDVELHRGAQVLAGLLDRLDRERMVAQADAMTIALQLGLVDAADFATGRGRRITPSG